MRYVAMGDSLTAGIAETPPGTRWADLLAERLRARHGGVTYENVAVFGQTSAEIRATQLPVALAAPADVISLICGGNDIMKHTQPDVDAFAGALDAMFAALRAANPGALLIGGRIADVSRLLPYRERSRARVARATAQGNAAVDEIAARYGVRVLDLSTVDRDGAPEWWASDGLHPSVVGQRAIFQAALAVLAGGEPAV